MPSRTIAMPSLATKVPNRLALLAEPVWTNPRDRERYGRQRANISLYRSAARLWSAGLPWNTALQILRDAVNGQGV